MKYLYLKNLNKPFKILKNIKPLQFAQICMGLIFLLAALFRVFFPNIAKAEMQSFNIPYFFSIPLIVCEIFCGLCLIFNKYVNFALISMIVLMIFSLLLALYKYPNLILNISELFVFNPTPTDILLHFIYLLILFFIFRFKN